MKMRLVIFSGIVTAIAGMMIGVAATKIGQPDFKTLKYSTDNYNNLYNNYIWIGAGLGLTAGMAQECLRELKQQRDHENDT